MTARFLLEVFEHPDPGGGFGALSDAGAGAEDARLASFEDGYKAGWDDAIAAQDKETARIRADFARSLEDLGFTYTEAHRHVLNAIEPLLRDMVCKVMPRMAHRAAMSPPITPAPTTCTCRALKSTPLARPFIFSCRKKMRIRLRVVGCSNSAVREQDGSFCAANGSPSYLTQASRIA